VTSLKCAFAAVAFLLAAGLPASAAQPLSEGDIATLQAIMQSHIDQVSIDGALLRLNPKNGKITEVFPAKAHPKIMAAGKYYILCADFRDEAGKDVMVNFYMAHNGQGYIIFATTFGHDEALERMIKRGAAAAAN
jgi:hypothetical protein